MWKLSSTESFVGSNTCISITTAEGATVAQSKSRKGIPGKDHDTASVADDADMALALD